MSLSTPQKILDFWFGSDRSQLNQPAHIQYLMGVWFMRTKPEVEITFIAEADQIDALVDASKLSEEWFTPEGCTVICFRYALNQCNTYVDL